VKYVVTKLLAGAGVFPCHRNVPAMSDSADERAAVVIDRIESGASDA
jgi:hypothetical protein